MEPRRIVLIRGIHPNELDLAPEIAAELRKQGHKVRMARISFRDTMHGHSRYGKRKRHFHEFEGAAFVERIGFRYPFWHVFGLHSSPQEMVKELEVEPERNKLGLSHPPIGVNMEEAICQARAEVKDEANPAGYRRALQLVLEKYRKR